MPQKSIFCIALSRGRAGRLVLDLKEAKFANTEISALFLDQSARDVRTVPGTASPFPDDAAIQRADVVCGVMGWIAAVACHVIPGSDPIIAAGPIASTLNDANTVGVADGLVGLGVSDAKARRYENRVKSGQILVSVHTDSTDMGDLAREIFTAAGAEDIFTTRDVFTSTTPTRNSFGMSDAAFV